MIINIMMDHLVIQQKTNKITEQQMECNINYYFGNTISRRNLKN